MPRRLAALALMLMLAGCGVARDAHVPDFARKPYAPFARSAAIGIALSEWRGFGAPIDDAPPGPRDTTDKPERDPGLWQRVGIYWWLGQDADRRESRWTGKHDAEGREFPPQVDGDYAWSAAFISYVMRLAGAGNRFPYSPAHADYINAAARGAAPVLRAWSSAAYAPVPGDLICTGRAGAAAIRFADLPAPRFTSHCDLVVERQAEALFVIGGNVDDAVTGKHVPVTEAGLIADARYDWFVVLQVLYDSP